MNCDEFEQELEQSDDGSELPAVAEAHRRNCLACTELVEDLSLIRTQARSLRGSEQPADWVWQRIHQQLAREGVIKEDSPRRLVMPALAFGWFSRLIPSFAYAAVFAMALGVVYVYSILAPRVPVPAVSVPPPPNPPFAELFEKVPAEKRAVYVNNLDQVESSIQHLQTYMASHPDDPFAREALFNSYQEKSRLWEDLVRWEEF